MEMFEEIHWYDVIILAILIALFISCIYKVIDRTITKRHIKNAIIEIWKYDMINKVSNNDIVANILMHSMYNDYIYGFVMNNITKEDMVNASNRYKEWYTTVEAWNEKCTEKDKGEEENND